LIAHGRHGEAAELLRAQLESQRSLPARDATVFASALGLLARALLAAEPASAEAEGLLKECLEFSLPKKESWKTGEATTLLGACLLAQGRTADAEPLLRAGAESPSPISNRYHRQARREALLAMARWCEAAGRPDEAKTWRGQLAALEATLRR
jgi:hypothetical protein